MHAPTDACTELIYLGTVYKGGYSTGREHGSVVCMSCSGCGGGAYTGKELYAGLLVGATCSMELAGG